MATTPHGDGYDEPSQPRTARLASHCPSPSSSPRPEEREPKEVEGRLTFPTLLPHRRTPKREEVSLVGVQGQSEVFQPLAESIHHTLRIALVFEADDKVSNPEESHLRVLAEPDVNVSAHPAPIIQPPAPGPSASARTVWGRVRPRGPASASHGVCAFEVS